MPSGNRSPTPNQADRGSTRQQRGHCSSSTRPIWTRDRCVRWCECVIRHGSPPLRPTWGAMCFRSCCLTKRPSTVPFALPRLAPAKSEEHTSELQSLMRISYAVFCLKKKSKTTYNHIHRQQVRKYSHHYK